MTVDDLERKATAADQEVWYKSNRLADLIDDAVDAEYIAANSPPVTLALIARIRELEAACRCAAVALRMYATGSPTAKNTDDILDKGVVLP